MGASFATNCKSIVTASDDKTAKIWSVDVGECLQTLKGHRGAVYFASFSIDCSKILTASEDGTAKVWGVKHGCCERTLKHGSPVLDATFSDDAKTVRTMGQDGTLKIWNIRTGSCDRTMLGQAQSKYMAAFSHRGETFVSPGADNQAKIYSVDA